MRINNINESIIELYLSDDEIENIFGGYEFIDYDTPENRIKIHSLLTSAAPKAMLPIDCNKILIEVRPKKSGCTITLTKIYKMSKKYRQIKDATLITLIFEDSDSLIKSVEILKSLNIQSSNLYTKGEKYALIINIRQENKNLITHLSEYCKISKRRADAEKITEYWQPICKNEAVKKLSEVF